MSFFSSIFSPKQKDLKEMLHKEAVKCSRKAFKYEQVLNNDRKLAKYIKKTFVCAVKKMYSNKAIYIYPSDIDMDRSIFDTYYLILHKLCNELDIKVSLSGSIDFDKNNLKAFVESHKPTFDIDERVKAMLTTGIYR